MKCPTDAAPQVPSLPFDWRTFVIDLAVSLPALFAGSVPGIVAFRSINEIGFRRTILVLLLVSGASLALA